MPTARGLPPDALDKLVQAVEDLVTAAIRRIAGALARVIHGSPNAGAVNPVDDAAMILPLWATATTVTLMPAVQSVWTASAVALSEEFQAAGIANSPLGPDQAAAYLETAANRLVGIGNIVWAEVRTQLAEGVDLGEGIPELAERVMQAAGVSEERATVIARTEVISASNAASFAQAQTLHDSTMSKVWMATPDARTRHTHVVADGQTQPLMSPFEVGGFPLMFPGDPAGPPGEVINCRCTQGYDFEAEDVPPAETTVASVDGWDVIVAAFQPDQLRDDIGRWSRMHLNRLGVHVDPGAHVPASERINGVEGQVRVAHIIDFADGDHYIIIGSGTAAQMSGWNQTAKDDGRTALFDSPDALVAELGTALANARRGHIDGPARVVGDDLGDVDIETVDTPDGMRIRLTTADYDSQAEYEVDPPPDTFDDEDGNPRPLTDEERAEWIADQEAEAVKANAEFAPSFAILTAEQAEQLIAAVGLELPTVLTAAAEVHTGAMIALAPCVEDAYRLEVGSGEPAEQLHATLVYLGDDADLTPEQRHAILGMCVDLAASRGPLELDAFGVSIFNPTSDERDTAIVLPLGGEEGPELAALHDAVTAGVQLLLRDAMPQQHEPFAAHLTLIYSDDLSLPERVTDRNGPILFDHLRVAFGGDVFDIPLSTCGCDYGDALTAGVNNNPEFNRKHLRGPGGRFKTMGERVADAVNSGEGLDGFDRPQLMKAAKTHGIPLKRGESEDSIKKKLVDKLGGKGAKEPDKPKTPAKRAPRKAAAKKVGAPPEAESEIVPADITVEPVGNPDFDERLGNAAIGPDALAAAPLGRHNGGDALYMSLSHYVAGGYMGINGDLRKGDLSDPRVMKPIAEIDRGMAASLLTSDVLVFRGIHKPTKVFGAAWNDTDVSGLEWRDDGFTSTTADAVATGHFADKGGAVMRILAPKGTRALAISDPALGGGEMELLLDRGTQFRVVADHGVVNGRRQLDVEVVDPRKAAAKTAAPVPTWEELGKPQGPAPVGVPIGHEGGTYELLPGEPRRYRVINGDGKDISDQVMGTQPGRHQTAEDARTALRMDAGDRQRIKQAHDSGAVAVWDSIPGSWSYENDQIKGFRGATAAQKEDIRTALSRWTGHKSSTDDDSRQAEPTVNAALRGAVPLGADVQADIAALDLALNLSRTKKPITVYRGVTNGEHILPDDWQERDLTGLEWSTGGYTPTSGNIEAGEAYAGSEENRGFMMRIHLPKGASAVAIRDAIGGNDDEGEVVLPRGLTFHVVKDNGPQGEFGIRQLDVEVSEAKPEPAPVKRAPRKAAKKAAPKPAEPEAWRQDIDARLDAVRATSKTPVKEDRPLGGGMMGVVNLQTHDDGTMLVSKNGSKGGYIRPPKSQADAEELAALVAPALGVRAPAVVRTSDDDVLMEHIDGKDGAETVPWGAGLMDTPDGPALVNSDQGRLLGLTDLVIANFDRNNGNWILAPEGDLVAIDHGMSFMGPAQGVEVRAVYDDEDSPGDERWALFVDGQRVADTPTFEERDDAMDEVSDFEGDGSGLKVGDLLDGALGNAFALPFINEARNDFGPNDMSPDDMATIRPRLEGLRPDFARLGREPWFDAMMGRFDAIAANATGDKSRLGKPTAPKKAAAKAVKKAATPKVKAYAGPEFTLPKGVDQADYDAYRDLQARIKANDPDLDPDDYSRIFDLRDKLSPDAARRAGQEAHIQTNFGDWAQRNFPDRDVAEVQAELAGKAREAFAGKKVAVRVTPTGLSRMLKDGRFKTFYETGRTESFDPTSRPKAEASMFGLGPDTDPTVRPIYGYVMVDGDRPAGDSDTDALSQYGRIQVVLKDATRPRTTAMFGDSLDNEQQGRPSPIDDPEWRSYTYANGGMLGRALSTPDRDMSGDLFHRATYAEAEIHGGVHTFDIAEVLLPGDTSAALRKQLDDAGIPWRILGEAGAPAAKPAKAAPKKRAPLKAAAPKAAPTAKATTAARAALSKAFDGDTAGFRQAATPMFEGTHAGMTTSIVSVTKAGFGAEGQHMMQVRGTVHDGSGVKVGFFTRTFRRDRGDGSLVVEHDQMFLDKDVQAAGFATSFNRQAIDEYRRAGVSKITLDAGSDVGGYAWARAGYTWADQVSADGIKFHISFYIGRLRDPNRGFDLPGEAEFDKGRDTEGQLRAAQALLRRMGGNITDPDYPTPYEISQLGRWPGAGRGDMWIGKHFLLGPSGAWLGELKL